MDHQVVHMQGTKSTATILLTGYATEEMLESLHIVTPNVLLKPVEIEELKSPVQYREQIGGSSGAGEGV